MSSEELRPDQSQAIIEGRLAFLKYSLEGTMAYEDPNPSDVALFPDETLYVNKAQNIYHPEKGVGLRLEVHDHQIPEEGTVNAGCTPINDCLRIEVFGDQASISFIEAESETDEANELHPTTENGQRLIKSLTQLADVIMQHGSNRDTLLELERSGRLEQYHGKWWIILGVGSTVLNIVSHEDLLSMNYDSNGMVALHMLENGRISH